MGDEVQQPIKRRTFKKFTYRGVDLDQLLNMSNENLKALLTARARRKIDRGLKRKHLAFLKVRSHKCENRKFEPRVHSGCGFRVD